MYKSRLPYINYSENFAQRFDVSITGVDYFEDFLISVLPELFLNYPGSLGVTGFDVAGVVTSKRTKKPGKYGQSLIELRTFLDLNAQSKNPAQQDIHKQKLLDQIASSTRFFNPLMRKLRGLLEDLNFVSEQYGTDGLFTRVWYMRNGR